MSGELPEGWAETQLQDLLAEPLTNGRSVPDGTGFPVLRLTALRDGHVQLSERKLGAWSLDGAKRYLVRKGDFLVARGNGSLALVGRGALVHEEPDQVAYPDTIIRVRPNPEALLPRYLRSVWASRVTRAQLEHVARTSAGIHKVSQQDLEGIRLPVAPKAEQHRIVAQVEALLADVRKAKERLDRVPRILKRFRQAVLAAACSGELTREWRETERQIDTPSFKVLSGSAAPDVDLPAHWSWVATQDICDDTRAITYGVIKLGEPAEDGVPTLRSSDVRWLRIDETSVKRIASTIANQYTRTFLRGGEVLVTVRGTLGGVAAVPPNVAGYNISREVAVLPLKSGVDAAFVALAVASMGSQNWLQERTKGAAYTGINIEDLRLLPLAIPPREEQAELVRRVNDLFSLADAIERRVATATARADKIPQAILTKAFSGELVPTEAELARAEGRAYETAEELLARVRGEAAKETAAPKVKRAPRQRRETQEG